MITPITQRRLSCRLPAGVLLLCASIGLAVPTGCGGTSQEPTAHRYTETPPITYGTEGEPAEVPENPQARVLLERLQQQLAALEEARRADAARAAEPADTEGGIVIRDLPVAQEPAPRQPVAESVVPPLEAGAPHAYPVPGVAAEDAQPPAALVDPLLESWDAAAPPVTEPAPADLEAEVLQRLSERPSSAASVLDYELLRLLEGDVTAAQLAGGADDAEPVATAGDLTEEDRRLLGTVREGLLAFRQTLRRAEAGPAPLPSEKIEPLMAMARELRRQVGLTLPEIVLCSSVTGFGAYESLAPQFPTGQPRRTILYVEVDHFASRASGGGGWETNMTLSAVLYDPEGRPVMTMPETQIVDHSRRKRRDFFISGYLDLPAAAEAGEYVLKVSVRDDLSQRIAEQSLKVEFVSAPAR